MTPDSCIIPMLDPRPTDEEWDLISKMLDGNDLADTFIIQQESERFAAHRAAAARQAIEWCIARLGFGDPACRIEDLLAAHDLALSVVAVEWISDLRGLLQMICGRRQDCGLAAEIADTGPATAESGKGENNGR